MVERRDVEAAVEARRELGPEYEAEIVDSLVEKIERRLEERQPRSSEPVHRDPRVLLGSVALGIPVTAVSLSNGHGTGGVIVAVIAWIAIALANLAYYAARR